MKLLTKRMHLAKSIGIDENLFDGLLMSWIGEAAAFYPNKFGHAPNLVTVHVGELAFKKPLRSGKHLRVYAEVAILETTSITLNVEVCKYSLYSTVETVVCTTSITFARLDDGYSQTLNGGLVHKNHEEQLKVKALHKTEVQHLTSEEVNQGRRGKSKGKNNQVAAEFCMHRLLHSCS